MKKYLFIGSLIGFLQILDAGILYAHDAISDSWNIIFAGMEMIWMIVSLVTIFRVKYAPVRILAGAFFGYMGFGMAIGFFLMSAANIAVSNPPVPMWTIFSGAIFGLTYSLSSLYLALKIKPKI